MAAKHTIIIIIDGVDGNATDGTLLTAGRMAADHVKGLFVSYHTVSPNTVGSVAARLRRFAAAHTTRRVLRRITEG